MPNPATDQVEWTLRGNVALLSCGKFSACVDAAKPNAGLTKISVGGTQLPIDLLRVYRCNTPHEKSWPLPVAESYVRANDFVASYQATQDWPFSPQLYWRANSLHRIDGVLASVSLLVSVQTHLLDTHPQIAVASRLSGEESLLVSVSGQSRPIAKQIDTPGELLTTNEDCCVVIRLSDAPFSYLEIMPVSDFHAISLRVEEQRPAFEWRLFAEFLEKGVIRRARTHAAIVSRENDIEIAAACCQAIEALELPLTT